jgi:hypothetical protein
VKETKKKLKKKRFNLRKCQVLLPIPRDKQDLKLISKPSSQQNCGERIEDIRKERKLNKK